MFVQVVAASVVTCLLSFAVPFLVSRTMGTRLGPQALASSSLGGLLGNLTGRSFIQGSLLAFDTLGPRAFGRNEHRLVGVLILRAFVLPALLLLPVLIAWMWAGPILTSLGQDPDVASDAARFLHLFQLALPFILVFEVVRRFSLIQGIAWPFTFATLLATIAVILLADTLVDNFGFDAAALMFTLGAVTQTGIAMAYMLCVRPGVATAAFPGWAGLQEAVGNWTEVKSYLKLAVPALLSMTEWWFWEFTCFRAGIFGVGPLAAHSLAYTLVPLLFQVPRGIRDGLSARCGVLLGQGRGAAARGLSCGAVLSGILLVCLSASVVRAPRLRRWYVGMMSQPSAEVARDCAEIWDSLAFFLVLDGLFPLLQGVCNIHGLQVRVSAAMIVSLWLVGAPAVLGLARDLVSLWGTFPLCYVLLNVLLIAAFAFEDWNLLAETASRRSREEAVAVTSLPPVGVDDELDVAHGVPRTPLCYGS